MIFKNRSQFTHFIKKTMPNFTISGATSPKGLNLNVSSLSFPGQTLSNVLISFVSNNGLTATPQYITLSTAKKGNGDNLTSVGRVTSPFAGTAWRMRNDGAQETGTLKGYGSSFVNTYDLPLDSDTYVISPFTTGPATHTLAIGGRTITKAASTSSFTDVEKDIILTDNDNYTLIGSAFGDTLTGANGNDSLIGSASDDLLGGGGGADTLNGGAGDDILMGGAGDDILTGGAGNDMLKGDAGNDFIRYNSPSEGIDTINGFVVADDTINVLQSGFGGGLNPGPITDPEFLSGAGINEPTDSFQRFIYNTGTGALFYDPDGTGSSPTVQLATLNGGPPPTITTADIVVI